MTKGLALLLLALGTALMAWGLALSVSVVPDAAPFTAAEGAAPDSCNDCHPAYPNAWQVAPHDLRLTTLQPTPMACVGCHDSGHSALSMPVSATYTRMVNLRSRIAHIYTEHQPDDSEYAIAQQAEAILTLIEADNRWGFHSSAYIETQLDDAERLLNTLAVLSR